MRNILPCVILNFNITILFLFLFTIVSASRYNYTERYDTIQNVVSRILVVDKSGSGNFTTIQQAIDSTPNDNQLWIQIHIKAGIYNEKITIQNKQFLFLDGEDTDTTIIAWSPTTNASNNPTFTMQADNFIARNITFKNTYNRDLVPVLENGRSMTQAYAASIEGDKVSFYSCGFVGLQDTVYDVGGRHYFESSHIEGAVDFIFGNGQSFYKGCTLNVTGSLIHGKGYITAQGRESANESSGFVFHSSNVIGTGHAYLGRAWRKHARVLFYNTYMDHIILPEGWDNTWNDPLDLITFAEEGCSGPGANKSRRVKWEKSLTTQELDNLVNINNFINKDGWMEKQPLRG
ncbi:hypothetical protein UlMin_029054 [Ulmus minor]